MKPDGYTIIFRDGTRVDVFGPLGNLAPLVNEHLRTLRGAIYRGRGVIEGIRALNPASNRYEHCRVVKLFAKDYQWYKKST